MAQYRVLTALALLMLAAGCAAPARPVAEAAPACNLPAGIVPAPALTPSPAEVVKDEPTAFYMLALTWAPQDCGVNGENPGYAVQCKANDFGFVLHGLWPNGAARRHPRYCGPAPAISAATVRKYSCMTPAPVMLQHEWAAHGTCGWDSPEAYFAQAATLWHGLTLPPMDQPSLTAGQIRDAFAAANPGVPREGVYIKTAEGSRLEDVRLCYDLTYRPTACRGLGAPDATVVQVTPRTPR